MCKKRVTRLGWGISALFVAIGLLSTRVEASPRITHTIPENVHKFTVGEVLVKFKDSPRLESGLHAVHGAAAEDFAAMLPEGAQKALAETQGKVVRVHAGVGLLKVQLPEGKSVGRAIEALYASGAVEYAEPNYSIKMLTLPNDPKFPDQWALHNTGATPDADIDAPEAWSIRTDGSQTVVALVDTGVDYNHPDLRANIWVNPGEIPDDGIDNDEDGWIDDVHGIDTADDDSDPMDTEGHGTAMAGIIGARGNNALGVAGVSWKAKIMPVRCTNSAGAVSAVEDAITGIDYALEMKVAHNYRMVLVLGWKTSGYSRSLRDALRLAQFKGVLVVAAAGNDDEDNDLFPTYPASHNLSSDGVNNMISVGASDLNDLKVNYIDYYNSGSNYGCSSVDLFAPGRDVLTTIPKGSSPNYDNAYTTKSGTSMAAAHVAGAAALVWSKNTTLKWKDIKSFILNGTEDGEANDFRPVCMTWGRLNLNKSLAPALLGDPAIFEVTPSKATAGDSVVITGHKLGNSGTLKFLYGSPIPISSIVSWTPNRIEFTIPASLPKGAGRLQVTTGAGTSRGACFSHVSPETLVPGQHLILERGFAASAQVGNNVYIIGGNTSYGLTGLVEKYSLDKQMTVIDCKWKMPVPVSNAGAAAVNSKIYVFGGLDEAEVVRDTLQIFDTVAGTWTQGAKLLQPIMQPTVVAFDSKIYVFGGLSSPSGAPLNTTYMYNPATNTWANKMAMPTGVSYGAGAPYGTTKIWVMGGFTGSYSKVEQRLVQEYNPTGNTWASKPHLIRPRAGAAGTSIGTKMFCLHGTPFADYPYPADKYADGEWFNPTLGYWAPSILMEPFVPYTAPRPYGLYTPSPGKYSNKVFLLGGVSVRSYSEYLYSHSVWHFTSP